MFVLRWLRRGLILIGLALFLGVGGAYVFELTGGVERIVRRQLQAKLQDEAVLTTNFDSLEIDWLAPSATLRGLTIEGAGGSVRINRTQILLDASALDNPLVAIDVTGGRVVFTDAFAQALGRALQGTPEDPPSEPETGESGVAPFPLINVTDIDFALGGKQWGPEGLLELGRGSARVERDPDPQSGRYSARGTLALITDEGVTAPLFYTADLDPESGLAITAAARHLELKSRGNRLRRLLPEALRGFDMNARASLDLAGHWPLDAATPPDFGLNFQIDQGYLRPSDTLPALEAFELKGNLVVEPKAGDWLDRSFGAGTFVAKIAGEELVGQVDLVAGGHLRTDLLGAGLTLSDRRLAELGFPQDGVVRQEWLSLAFDGRADVRVGVQLFLKDPLNTVDVGLSVAIDGESRVQYNGFQTPGYPREGIPLPVDQVGGQVVGGFNAAMAQPSLIGILDAHGHHGTGLVTAEGLIASPRVVPAPGELVTPDMDLVIKIQDRALDEGLRVALNGMYGTNWIWDAFQPDGGLAQGLVALQARPELDGLTVLIDLDVAGANVRWNEFPMNLTLNELKLGLRWAESVGQEVDGWPYRAMGGRFEAKGSSASVAELAVEGMIRATSFEAPPEVSGLLPMSFVRVTAPGLALRGSDFDELSAILPELKDIGQELGAKGRVDVVWQDAAPGATGARETNIQVTPSTVELLPKSFPMVTREVRGQVLMSGTSELDPNGLPTPQGLWQAHLVGDWTGGMRLGASYQVGLDGVEPGRLEFVAGSLDPSNSALLGALASGQGSEVGNASTEGLALDGRVDLTGAIRLSEAAAEPEFDVYLRHNRFAKERLVVKDLHGSLRIADGAVFGAQVTGQLAETPITLNNVRFAFDEQTRTGDEYFSTELSAQSVPLDQAHLQAFMESDALEALLDEFKWRGQLDLDRVRLGLARASDGRESTRLSGLVIARDLHMDLGAPVDISIAKLQLRDFVLEGERARAWGTVAELRANVANRVIDNGRFLFSYVDQRLTVQDLDTDFAGGKLRSLGGTSAAAIAVDLAPPYHMAVSLELDNVDAGPMLEDAFGGARQVGARNQGKVDASVRFEAIPGDILVASGAGWLRVREARLWSIPVFRELFTQLGFDATGVFDSMRTNFSIRDGALHLGEMRAHSPLLELVGDGRLDMNGDMAFDLEVRYSLIDKLGPLRYIVYWFQNSLLRVQVRGDLHRPVVLLRNSVFDVFKRKFKNKPRLPLPYPDALPARF